MTIQLTKEYPYPLFGFSSELFGVIPKHCVNLATNKVICRSIPTSGYYQIAKSENNRTTFQLKAEDLSTSARGFPHSLQFIYRSPIQSLSEISSLGPNEILIANESNLTLSLLSNLEKILTVKYLPAAWFGVLQINPDLEPFKSASCRFRFAQEFRANFEKFSTERSESSLFTRYVKGYRDHSSMSAQRNISSTDKADCLQKFKNFQLSWGSDGSAPETFSEILKRTALSLHIIIRSPISFKDRTDEIAGFMSGKISVMYGKSGFLSQDSKSEARALFARNLHAGLEHLWRDQALQKVLQGGENTSDDVTLDLINNYLFNDAKFNVYRHFRRFYASKNKALIENLPAELARPYPWQLFAGLAH